MDTEKGLLTPVIKDAGDLSVAGLAKKIGYIAGRTRTNKIGPDELSGGTFTITNLGSFGALFDTPIINKPQVAILGPGAVVKRPVVIDDPNLGETIAVRYMVYLSLTYDHQLVDGADAAGSSRTSSSASSPASSRSERTHRAPDELSRRGRGVSCARSAQKSSSKLTSPVTPTW